MSGKSAGSLGNRRQENTEGGKRVQENGMIQVIRKGKRERWDTLRKEDGGEYRAWTEGSKITMWLKNSQDIIMLPNLKKKKSYKAHISMYKL